MIFYEVIKIKIAICEDEKIQSEQLKSSILKWKLDRKIDVNIDIYSSAESYLFADIKDYDLLILDIQMNEIDGITLAKKIRETNSIVKIVFITGISDFIGEGYEVEALHYLLKPVNQEKLFLVLDKALVSVFEKFVLIDNTKINEKDFLYIESIGHKVKVKTIDNEFILNIAFKDFFKTIDFLFQCHRSFAVNIRRIKSITKTDIIMDNDERILVSRRLHKATCEAFTNYFGESMYGI